MYRKMLVALDGSGFAEVVFPYAKELAARLGVEVVLLHIVSPEERSFFEPLHRSYINEAVETIRRQAKAVAIKGSIQPVQVRGEIVVGYPDEEIPRFAGANGIDLILMATHDNAAGRHRALGHVAEKVLHQSRIPVWLVRAGVPAAVAYDKWPEKTLIVTLDGSELAESVLPHVEALAQQRGETVGVALLRVCEPPPMPSYYGMELSGVPMNWGQYVQQEMDQCQKISGEYLAGIEKRLKAKNITVRSEVLTGKPSQEIIGYAAKNLFGLIVMTTHGRSGLGRLVYGSVAESVLLGASNPIFLVRVNN